MRFERFEKHHWSSLGQELPNLRYWSLDGSEPLPGSNHETKHGTPQPAFFSSISGPEATPLAAGGLVDFARPLREATRWPKA